MDDKNITITHLAPAEVQNLASHDLNPQKYVPDPYANSLCNCQGPYTDTGDHLDFSYEDAYAIIRADTKYRSPILDTDMVKPHEEIITEKSSKKTNYRPVVMSPLERDDFYCSYDFLKQGFVMPDNIFETNTSRPIEKNFEILEKTGVITDNISPNEDELSVIDAVDENIEKNGPLCSKSVDIEIIKEVKQKNSEILINLANSSETTNSSSNEVPGVPRSSDKLECATHEIAIIDVDESFGSESGPTVQQRNSGNSCEKELTLSLMPKGYTTGDWATSKTRLSCSEEDWVGNDVQLLSDFNLNFEQSQMFVNFRNKFLNDEHPYFTNREMKFFVKDTKVFICYNYAGYDVPNFLRPVSSKFIEKHTLYEFDICIRHFPKRQIGRHCHIPWNTDLKHESLIPALALSKKLRYFYFEITYKMKEMWYRVYDITRPTVNSILLVNLGDENLTSVVYRVDHLHAKKIQKGISEIKAIESYPNITAKYKLYRKAGIKNKESFINLVKFRILNFGMHLSSISNLNLSYSNLYVLKSKLKDNLLKMVPIEIPKGEEMILSTYEMKVTSLYHFIIIKCVKFELELLRLINQYQLINP